MNDGTRVLAESETSKAIEEFTRNGRVKPHNKFMGKNLTDFIR